MGKYKWLLLAEAGEGNDLAGGPAEPQGDDDSAKWADFLSENEEEPVDLDDEETPVTEEPAPTSPQTEPAPTQETPAVLEGQETPTAPAIPPAPVATPEQLKEYKEKFSAALESHYAFDEEQATALQVEPEKVLPKLAARLHMEVLDNVMQHVYSALPNVIQSYTEMSSREMKAQEEFYGAWPELKGHDQQVLQMGQMYRQMNPAATPQEAIQRIGEMTMAALGKKRAQAVAEQTPAAPPAPPYRPAAPGRVGAPPPAKTKWESVFDDDD